MNTFYQKMGLTNRYDVLCELRKKDQTDNMDPDDYLQYKEIIEEATWALNCYLNKQS